MAASLEYVEFVCYRIKGAGDVRFKKMFGEYMAYLNEKPILLVCDNTVFIKKLPEIEALMRNAECGFPYDGAKEHYVLDIESADLLLHLIPVLEAATPVPKPKKKQ